MQQHTSYMIRLINKKRTQDGNPNGTHSQNITNIIHPGQPDVNGGNDNGNDL